MNGLKAGQQFLDTLHRSRKDLDGLGMGLRALSDALVMVGNRELAEKLEAYAERAEAIGDRLVEAYGEKLDVDVHESIAGIGRTLKAMIDADPADLDRRFGVRTKDRQPDTVDGGDLPVP